MDVLADQPGVLRMVFEHLPLPSLAAASLVCRRWYRVVEGTEDDANDFKEAGALWRAVALRHLPAWREPDGDKIAADDVAVSDQRSIEERKRELWGRPAVVAPEVPLARWKYTLRCVMDVFRSVGALLESNFSLDAWHDMRGVDRGWDYDLWHYALHLLQLHDVIVMKGREVHAYSVTEAGRVCLAEGSPEMVTYTRVPPGDEGMRMLDLKEWAKGRDVKGINQALALGWIAIHDDTEETDKLARAAADPATLNQRKSLARVVRSADAPRDEVREQLAQIERHAHEDNRGLFPKARPSLHAGPRESNIHDNAPPPLKEVYANLKRRKFISNQISRSYRVSRGINFVSHPGEVLRVFALKRPPPSASREAIANNNTDDDGGGDDDVEVEAGPSGERESVFSHKTKYFQLHKGFYREEREVSTSVRDMLLALDRMAAYTAPIRDLEQWLHTDAAMVVDAVLHNLVLVGEAGGIVMNELLRREKTNDNPVVPRPVGINWEELVVMRNNIIHKYFIFHDDLTRRTRMKQAWELVGRLLEHGRPALQGLLAALQQAPSV